MKELRDTNSDLVVPPADQPAPSSWLCLHGCSSQSASYQRQQEVPPRRAQRVQSGSLPGRRAYGVRFFSYSPSLAAFEYPLLQAGDPATLQVFPELFSCPLLLLCSDRQWQPENGRDKERFPCEKQENWAPTPQLSPQDPAPIPQSNCPNSL